MAIARSAAAHQKHGDGTRALVLSLVYNDMVRNMGPLVRAISRLPLSSDIKW